MRRFRRKDILAYLISVAIMIALLVSCNDVDLFNARKCYRLELTASSITTDISKQERFTISATTYQKNGDKRSSTDMVWVFSPNDSVEIVYKGSDSITFRVIKPGDIVLTAYDASDSSITKAVIITATGALKEIRLSETSISLNQKEAYEVYISFDPSAASDKSISIEVKDPSIVTATEGNGILTITGNRPGSTYVTVRSNANQEISATCSVTVRDIEIPTTNPKYIKLSSSYLHVEDMGSTARLDATIYDGYNQEVSGTISWKSSDNDVVSIAANGSSATIKPRNIGSCIITATLDGYPDIFDTAQIVVGNEISGIILEKVNQSSIKMTRDIMPLSMENPQSSSSFPINGSAIYKVSFLPENTTQTNYSYACSGIVMDILKDGNYLSVAFPAAGEGTITVKSTINPNIFATASVYVYNPEENPDNSISQIQINPSYSELEAGGSAEFTATAYDHNGNPVKTDFKWEATPDSGLALEASNSVVYAKAFQDGEYELKAYSVQNPSILGKSLIRVSNDRVSELTALIPSSEHLSLVVGNSAEITISQMPLTAEIGQIEWSCDNEIAVDISTSSNGSIVYIKAKSEGTAKLSGKSDILTDKPVEVSISVLPAGTSTSPMVNTMRLEESTISMLPPYTDSPKGIMVYSEDSSGNQIDDEYTWEILDSSIIRGETLGEGFENQYLVYPILPGETDVRITSKSNPYVSAICHIIVGGKLQSIRLSPASIKLDQGSKATIDAELVPTELHDSYKEVKWTLIDNPQNSASFEATGYKAVVSGTSRTGKATLRVSSMKDPTIYADCQITVTDEELPNNQLPNRIELSSSSITITPPATGTVLSAEVYSTNGSIYPIGVTWEIEDETIIEITTEAQDKISIEPLRSGTTKITARSIVDPSIIATCIVNVTGQITGISPESMNIQITKGDSYPLKIELKPSNTIETSLEYTVQPIRNESGSEISIVELTPVDSADYQGVLIKGIELGTTTMNIKSTIRPSISANVAITVVEPAKVSATISISPSAVEISPESKRTLITGNLIVSNDSPSINENLSFRIDPVGLVDITEGGTNQIYLVPNGTAGEGTIYAYLPSYPYIEEGKARLFVGGQLRSLIAEGEQSVAVNVGETVHVSVEYNPENTTETGIIWSSSNESVARVNGGSAPDAIITGISSGTATITATSKYYPDKKVEFTVVVKSIINEVAFTDQFGNKGLAFYTDTTTPLQLACEISPDIEKKLVYKPKSANIGSLSILQPIAGTVNDVEFLPDAGAGAGIFEFNVMYNNKVVDVLSISCTYKGLGISSDREVFKGDYRSTQLVLRSDAGDVASDQIDWKSSDTSVASVDSNGNVQARSPGVAVISATIKTTNEKLTTTCYVNVDIPASFEAALRRSGYLEANGDTVLPEDLDSITTLDLRNIPSDTAVDISGVKELPNIEILRISGISLASSEISLSGLSKLRILEANNCELTRISAVPSSLEEVYASNNLISSYSSLVNNNIKIKILDLSSNRITSYTDLLYAEKVYLSNNQITYLKVSSTRLQYLDLSSNLITSATVSAPELRYLNLNNNKLNYNSFTSNDGKSISADKLETLYLANNTLGLYANKDCPSCSGKRQSANESTYGESESQNREQPLADIRIDSFPNLKEINLQNNHIRSGLNGSDKSFLFRIYSPRLEKVMVQGNHIGNYFQFANSNGTISSLPTGSAYNNSGITVNYDRGGCFYTGQTWHNGWWLLGWHDRYMEYWIGTSYMY